MLGEKPHAHEVAADAAITCGGQACVLADLKTGFTIRVTTEKRDDKVVATKIEAQEAKS